MKISDNDLWRITANSECSYEAPTCWVPIEKDPAGVAKAISMANPSKAVLVDCRGAIAYSFFNGEAVINHGTKAALAQLGR